MKKSEFIDITIESILKGIQWAITFGLTYIILWSVLKVHIEVIATEVCPLLK